MSISKIADLRLPVTGGIQLAHGDVIGFLDVDDLWPEGKLKHQLDTLVHRSGLEMVLGQVQCLRLTGFEAGELKFKPFSKPFFTFVFGAVLIRKSVFQKVGLLDETLFPSEDLDWFMRAKENNVGWFTSEQVTLLYRLHENNRVKDQAIRNANLMKMLKKSIDRRRRDPNLQIS